MKNSKSLKVALIVPSKRLRCLGTTLWVQRYGPLQVAQVAHEAGYFVRVYNEEITNNICPKEIAINYDVVAISSKSCAITRAEEIVKQIKTEANQLNRRIYAVLGGEHASMSAGNRISSVFDYILPGESEEAFLDILDILQLESMGIHKQLNYDPSKNFNQCKSFNNVPDISIVQGYENTVQNWLFKYFPFIWTVKRKQFPIISFQGTRGCPYNCSFCPTPKYLHGRQYRRRDADSAVKFLKEHINKTGIKRVIFEDPIAAIPFDEESHVFFDILSKNSIPMKATLLVRPDLYKDKKLLELMRKSGVLNLSIGIESLNDDTRKAFGKKTSQYTLSKSIEEFHRFGFSVSGLFIVGYDTENLDSFRYIKEFIKDTGLEKWRVSPLGQMPEVPNQFLPIHRTFYWDELDKFGYDLADFINGEFVFIFPKRIKPSELQESIGKFNNSLLKWNNTVTFFMKRKRLRPSIQRIGNNIAQRMIQREVTKTNYIQMLQEIETPFYKRDSSSWILDEQLLSERHRLLDDPKRINEYQAHEKNHS
jgi:radical SAM superfamily enzyme YgiQ (UPF0313 family)